MTSVMKMIEMTLSISCRRCRISPYGSDCGWSSTRSMMDAMIVIKIKFSNHVFSGHLVHGRLRRRIRIHDLTF